MAAEGHAIGLHSGTRRLMVMSPDALAEHLLRAAVAFSRSPGRAVPAVPSACRLAQRDDVRGAEAAGYRLAGWSWGMWDWDWWRMPGRERIGIGSCKKRPRATSS